METVALSTTEAEFMALTEAGKDVVHLRRLLEDVGYKQEGATVLKCDNQSALQLVKSDHFHSKTKHIGVRFYFVRQLEQNGIVKTEFVRTDEQPADMLTKSICGPSLEFCRRTVKLSE